MRPTPRQLIESIIAAIDTTIMPAVEEKQAASSLRAARTLLEHLATRVEIDRDVLTADNDDARETLSRVGETAAATPRTGCGLEALQQQNDAYQLTMERLLRSLPSAGNEKDERQVTVRRELRAYLARRHERERPMIIPAFLGPPF